MSSYDQDHCIDRPEEERRQNEFRQRSLSTQIQEILDVLGLYQEEPLPPEVTQEYLDSLDRVDKKQLKQGDECAICTVPYLDDKYPLVVALPCKGRHRFDLECISKWLRRSSTCPMCRTDLIRRPKPAPPVDDEDPVDDMYA